MPEYYRGGERSPFKVSFVAGQLSVGASRGQTTVLDVPAGTQERIKRLAVSLVVPKWTTNNVYPAGWVSFLRVAHGAQVSNLANIDMADPQVLRPKVFVANEDHAIYIELYLEAVNMDGGERIQLFGYSSSSINLRYAAKWYSEASFR